MMSGISVRVASGRFFYLAVLISSWTAPTVYAQPQESRREYATPGLVVETGGRRGACDALLFTKDGKSLLAAGDDKVVRSWQVERDTGLRNAEMPILRWTTWHEKRGNIYAMALSPDRDNRFVAIGGLGITTGAIAILDRLEGKIKHGFSASTRHNHGTIWAMAFAPSGKQVAFGEQDGSVWVWDFDDAKSPEPRLVGKHAGNGLNFVRVVHYSADQQLISAAENGEVLQWQIPAHGQDASPPTTLFRFASPKVFSFALSADGQRLAAGSDVYELVEVIDLPRARNHKQYRLPKGHFAHSLAFDPKNPRLAVGIRIADPDANFYREIGNAIQLYDLDNNAGQPQAGPTPTFHPDALAFHPEHNLLAVAGGNDHEVTLWDLATMKRVGDEIRGPGKSLWSVALSADSRFLGFKDQRDANPAGPNQRGRGEWRVFDLHQRKFAPAHVFKPAEPIAPTGGWKLHTSYPAHAIDQLSKDKQTPTYMKSSSRWFVESPARKIFELPFNRDFDSLPRCYAFLAATKSKPWRLGVGHLWGVTIYDLTDKGPSVSRRLIGHEGEVMSLAVSADQKRLVTASRDQTLAGWSLEDWPQNAELGAHFAIQDKRLLTIDVDAGSPAWEAGLTKGDEIVLLAAGERLVFNDEPRSLYKRKDVYPATGSVKLALQALERPIPGVPLYLGWKRPGAKQVTENVTSVIQRPLWRFFPTRDNEWVLWRWRDYFYDTSTNGDSLIGWQRNAYDVNTETPTFYRAEQFRKRYHRPDLIATMLKSWKDNPQALAFPDIVPPEVKLETKQAIVVAKGANELRLTLTALPSELGADHKTALPRDPRENQQLDRVILWINDYRVKEWKPSELELNAKGEFHKALRIPHDILRAGTNVLTLQCYNKGNVRGESAPVRVECQREQTKRTLYGIFVGVGDYRHSNPRQPDLKANSDAAAMHKLWLTQRGKLYDDVRLSRPLLDGNATRANILKQLDDLVGKVKPDDRLVFFMAGHGTRPEQLQKALGLDAKLLKGLGSFVFCCGNFDVDELRGTTVNFEELYERFAQLPCHKLLLLDACHSGIDKSALESNPSNPVRLLTQDGIGPIIMAACQPDESAFEAANLDVPERPDLVTYGLFATAVRRTATKMFMSADRNQNRDLEPTEMRDQVQAEIQRLLRRLRDSGQFGAGDQQNPIDFIPAREAAMPLVTRQRN
jgi:WD40 repeat protein